MDLTTSVPQRFPLTPTTHSITTPRHPPHHPPPLTIPFNLTFQTFSHFTLFHSPASLLLTSLLPSVFLILSHSPPNHSLIRSTLHCCLTSPLPLRLHPSQGPRGKT
ncbi:hypothetical protein E2C01_004570 [Portunus trituberculatus]|uniref:Uncharacterized protein n=1 Tax=Portunus trituberculatus TaxID=210409 RepID=A0A5B7CRQ3_PORTR|nr:hypothetical protein [Portunus trituberculatus]